MFRCSRREAKDRDIFEAFEFMSDLAIEDAFDLLAPLLASYGTQLPLASKFKAMGWGNSYVCMMWAYIYVSVHSGPLEIPVSWPGRIPVDSCRAWPLPSFRPEEDDGGKLWIFQW